jgi:hypothetical protein
VCINAAGNFKLTDADAIATSHCIGIVTASVANGATGSIAPIGIVTATTGQWDAVTSQTGGLTQVPYYLSATAGKLTVTAPVTVGQVVAPIGEGLSTTEFLVKIQAPTVL